MYTRVCLFVYTLQVSVCMHACACVYARVCQGVYTRVPVCMHACVCVYIACACVQMHACLCATCSVCLYARVCLFVHIHVCTESQAVDMCV